MVIPAETPTKTTSCTLRLSISVVVTPPASNGSCTPKSDRFVWIDESVGFLSIEKLLNHILRDVDSSETTSVDDIMHTALVDGAVANAPLQETLGLPEVIHVQLLEQRKIRVNRQRIDLDQ